MNATIEQDIPCYHCGYDLRGLPRDGQCPECGTIVGPSILDFEDAQRHALALADPKWIRSIAEGFVIACVQFVLMVALALAPNWSFRWNSPQRVFTLGVACTVCVLSWFACWKVTAASGIKAESLISRRRVLRVSSAIYCVLFFISHLEIRSALFGVCLISIALLSITAAIFGWFIYVAGLSNRLGKRGIAIAFWLLTVVGAPMFIVMGLAPELDGPIDSLSGLFRVSTPQFGSIKAMCDVWQAFRSGYDISVIELLALIPPLVSAVLTLWLAILFHRAASAAAHDGKTAANSRP